MTFIIERFLGMGGFGVAVLIKDDFSGKRLVVKIVKRNGEVVNEKIILEEILQKKCFRHLLCLENYFEYKNFIIFVTDYLPGITLDKFIRECRAVREEDFEYIMFQLLYTLDYLHNTLNIAHLDLKPSNIMINPETFDIWIIDYGISCFRETCTVSGTLNYMSIENFLAFKNRSPLPKEFLKTGDIFSLGIVLLELFLGSNPYSIKYQPGKMPYGEFNVNPIRKCIRNFRTQTQADLMKIIQSMLNVDPKKRPTPKDIYLGFTTSLERYKSQNIQQFITQFKSENIFPEIKYSIIYTILDFLIELPRKYTILEEMAIVFKRLENKKFTDLDNILNDIYDERIDKIETNGNSSTIETSITSSDKSYMETSIDTSDMESDITSSDSVISNDMSLDNVLENLEKDKSVYIESQKSKNLYDLKTLDAVLKEIED